MAYTPITWERGDVITVSRLNHMEEGIDDVGESVDSLKDTVDGLEEQVADRDILVAPNGTRYRLKVANDGTLSTEAVN